MSSLKQLRNRIKSVASTQKITAAMKMVAAAKLRRMEENVKNSKPFRNTVQKTLNKIAAYGEIEKLPKSATGSDSPPLFILFSSDKGLCGGFNATMFKTFTKAILPYTENLKPFFCLGFGHRASQFLKKNYEKNMIHNFEHFDPINSHTILKTTKMLKDLVESSKIGRIIVVYTAYKNVINLIPTVETLIPLKLELNKNLKDEKDIYLFEPKASSMLHDIIELYLSSQILNYQFNSETCEHAARMTAMENSTQNAKEIVAKLKLTYNRTRQTLITKELIEIISGAKAATD
ncbi:MAG: ATP synthase F1 subunit gamma [Proteobacteria bacterium]|nr:ATP synthase F1 subunit gamma [Pseudomonadota bacterium]